MDLKQTVEPTLDATLAPLLQQRAQLQAWIASHKEEIDSLNDEIKSALINADQMEVVVDGQKVTYSEREKSTLDKKALLLTGVTTEQIQKATKTTTYMQLDVRAVKEKE